MARLAAISLASALALGACNFDFQTSDQVLDRRILAIETDPPEVANGAPLPTALAVRSLVVDPSGPMASAPYEWRACPAFTSSAMNLGYAITASPSGRCDESDPATLLQSGDAPFAGLALNLPMPQPVLDALAQPDLGEPAPVLRFQLKVGSPAGDLYAIKDVVVTRTLPAGQLPNINPYLTGITFDDQVLAPGDDLLLLYGTCSSDKLKEVTDPATQEKTKVCAHAVKPLFDASESQAYYTRDPVDINADGPLVEQREQLQFAFFTDRGGFSSPTTTQPPWGTVPPDLGLQTEWEEPASKVGASNIWVVVRDGRGGESWSQWQITLQ